MGPYAFLPPSNPGKDLLHPILVDNWMWNLLWLSYSSNQKVSSYLGLFHLSSSSTLAFSKSKIGYKLAKLTGSMRSSLETLLKGWRFKYGLKGDSRWTLFVKAVEQQHRRWEMFSWGKMSNHMGNGNISQGDYWILSIALSGLGVIFFRYKEVAGNNFLKGFRLEIIRKASHTFPVVCQVPVIEGKFQSTLKHTCEKICKQ